MVLKISSLSKQNDLLSLIAIARERFSYHPGRKIIGAVTHVLVNDSAKGYGIFIENMLGAAA